MKKKLKPKNSDNDYQLYALLQRKIVSDTITPKELEKLNELKELIINRYELF